MGYLEINNIRKTYKNVEVLKNISFSMEKGEFLSVLGASGSGKTTLLRLIAGLEKIDHGCIAVNGKDITFLPPSKRKIGMVFQNYSLFPHMTVIQNITYALKCKKNVVDMQLLDAVISRCELEDLLDRLPCQLSGGQQQRTAIARSLVMSPQILLFDEPFSALDVEIRQNLRNLIKQFQDEFQITMIYVTHDQEEAFTLSDKIMILHEGVVQQVGNSNEIFNFPENLYVIEFTHKPLEERYKNLCKIFGSSKTIE